MQNMRLLTVDKAHHPVPEAKSNTLRPKRYRSHNNRQDSSLCYSYYGKAKGARVLFAKSSCYIIKFDCLLCISIRKDWMHTQRRNERMARNIALIQCHCIKMTQFQMEGKLFYHIQRCESLFRNRQRTKKNGNLIHLKKRKPFHCASKQ